MGSARPRACLGSTGNTSYTRPMAKVMISMPDELLEQVDRRAKRAGTTRSGYLRGLAERAMDNDAEAREERFREYLAQSRRRGGQGTEAIRRARSEHPGHDA